MAQSRTRRKKKGPAFGLVIGLCSLLVTLIIVALVLVLKTGDNKEAAKKEYIIGKNDNSSSKPSGKKLDSKKNEPKKELSNIDKLVDEIRLELFHNNITKNNIKEIERVLNNGTRSFDIYVASGDRKVLQSVAQILQKNKFNTEIDNNILTAINGKSQIVIALEAPAKKEEPKAEPAPKQDPIFKEDPANMKHVRLAFLLDDGGNNVELAKEFLKLKAPLTIAVIPFLKESKSTAKLIHNSDKSLFLHFPMEPKNRNQNDPGEGAVFIETPEIIVEGIVRKNFESLGVPVDGFNNHMGSALTEDKRKMKQVLEIAKNYTDTFIDSHTTPKTVGFSECQKIETLRCGLNKIFIDNVNDKNAIVTQIYEAVKKARREGDLIVIGHIRPNTLKALKEALPKLKDINAEVVPLAALTR